MLIYKLLTKNYKHEYYFIFQGEKYNVHSVVKLKDDGKKYLGSRTKDAILTEVFINRDGCRCWKYEFRSIERSGCITNASTDISPNKLIEDVISPASDNYMLREIYGTQWVSPSVTKHTKTDWEISEVRIGWIIFAAISIFAFIFKDWYITLIIQIVMFIWFVQYRKRYIDANTIYIHNEDTEMIRNKYDALYGLKDNKENKNHE